MIRTGVGSSTVVNGINHVGTTKGSHETFKVLKIPISPRAEPQSGRLRDLFEISIQ